MGCIDCPPSFDYVPDTRLQAIADAWSALTIKEQTEMPRPMYVAIKDALTQEDNDA
jgi:hypothetical protein